MDYDTFFHQKLTAIKAESRYRIFADVERCAGHFPHALYDNGEKLCPIILWCTNDYLGMGQHEKVLNAMTQALNKSGAGTGGTRNIGGTTPHHVVLEQELAALHEKEAALLFTSGYVANEAALSTLGSALPDCVIFSDANNHASIIQGIRNSRATKEIFAHNDVAHLRELLSRYPKERAKLIVFESIYSMDGDVAPLKAFCDLAEEYHALTYLDEVHTVGLYGHTGGGIAQQQGLAHRLSIIQGTLSKGFGVIGGYIAASASLVDFVRSTAPGFIFTTSLPPAIAAGAVASIRHLKSSTLERERHQEVVAKVKEKLAQASIPVGPTPSHIIPLMLGDAYLCKQASELLLKEHGIYVQAINYPTVPRGTERLRLTPSAVHTDQMIEELVEALKSVWAYLEMPRAA